MLSRFSHVRLCATPWTAAHQAPPSMGFPGKNTGVSCHFLLQCMKVKSECEVAQSCPTLSEPMDCSLPGSSIHGIFQAKVLKWVAMPSSRGSSQSRDRTQVSHIVGGGEGIKCSWKNHKLSMRQTNLWFRWLVTHAWPGFIHQLNEKFRSDF